MDKNELISKLDALGIHRNRYSLIGDKQADTIVLENIQGMLKVIYFDERGNEHDLGYFYEESGAYEFIYKKFSEENNYISKNAKVNRPPSLPWEK